MWTGMRIPAVRALGLVSTWLVTVALAWSACGGGSSGGTGAGGSTNCTGGPFELGCEACIEASCCSQAAECYDDPVCTTCTGASPPDAGACLPGKTLLWDSFRACVGFSCNAACLPHSTCNPVTNDGCQSPDACDLDQDGVFVCFASTTEAAICATCSEADGPPCQPTLHCVQTGKTGACARYCCNDGDCGGGVCDTSMLASGVGVCVDDHDGGAAPSCGPPAVAPSGGSCFTVVDAGSG